MQDEDNDYRVEYQSEDERNGYTGIGCTILEALEDLMNGLENVGLV